MLVFASIGSKNPIEEILFDNQYDPGNLLKMGQGYLPLKPWLLRPPIFPSPKMSLWYRVRIPGAPLTSFNDSGVRVIFLGLKFWPKVIFLGLSKTPGFFGVAKKNWRDFFGLQKKN